MRSTPVVVLVLASLAMVAVAAVVGHHTLRGVETALAPPPSYAARLDRLTWDELPAAAAALSKDRPETIRPACAASANPAARYLGVLLALAAGDDDGARAALAGVDPAKLPAPWLYGAARLQEALLPAEANRFWPALEKQIETLPPLLRARTAAHGALLSQALQAYMRTDPAQWTRVDLGHLQMILRQAGLATEAVVVLRAALRGGRVPATLRERLAGMVRQPGLDPEREAFKARVLDTARRDARAGAVLEASARRLLEMRRMFALAKFRALLDTWRGASTWQQCTEAVVLLTVAAAQQRDRAAFDLWSAELKRRLRTREAEQWTRDLRSAMR